MWVDFTHEDFTFLVEVLGLVSFSMSASFAAMQKRLDPFGVIIIAFVTSVGGGTVRDLLLDIPVFWMNNKFMLYLIFGVSIFTMIFKSIEKNFQVALFIFDSLGLGLFTIVGIQKGMVLDYSSLTCVVLGTITSCVGGILRDILLNRIPLVLRKEIYATACIVGGLSYIGLKRYSEFSEQAIQIISIFLIVAIRTLAVRFHWQIPKFYGSGNNAEI